MIGMTMLEVFIFMAPTVLPSGLVNQTKTLATSEGYHCQHSC
jgi:hypothetical protein